MCNTIFGIECYDVYHTEGSEWHSAWTLHTGMPLRGVGVSGGVISMLASVSSAWWGGEALWQCGHQSCTSHHLPGTNVRVSVCVCVCEAELWGTHSLSQYLSWVPGLIYFMKSQLAFLLLRHVRTCLPIDICSLWVTHNFCSVAMHKIDSLYKISVLALSIFRGIKWVS